MIFSRGAPEYNKGIKIKYVNDMLFVRMIKWTMYKKLVVPVDGSKPADKALDHAMHLAKTISVNGSLVRSKL
jgi:hypothetical protein